MTDDPFDSDPAQEQLAPEDYRHVSLVAADVVRLYGGSGPPFPILNLLALLEPSTQFLPFDDEHARDLYGFAFPLDYTRHHKHAALYLNPHGPREEVFLTWFHEAGHILLHILPPSCPTQVSHDRQRAPGVLSRDQVEIEADLFARLTTMPAGWVRTHWLYTSVAAATEDEAVAWMADLFNVPVAWMGARLRDLGLLPDLAPEPLSAP